MGTQTSHDRNIANLATVWVIAGLGGILATILLLFFADIGPSGAIFLAGILTVVVGLFLTRTMAQPLSPPAGARVAAPKAAPAAKSAPAPAAAQSAPAPAAAGARPAGLSAPRGDGADDLKLIKGVGPKLETLLHSMGYYHFDQIAAWSEAEVAWVDENLEGFKGRVTRDEWVAQARDLMKN